MYAGLTLVTPPSAEPVTVADAKAHSRISIDTDDSQVAGFISAARAYCESRICRSLLPQTWRLALRHWPGRSYATGPRDFSTLAEYHRFNFIELPRPPIRSITSFTYTDVSGNVFSMSQGYSNAVGNYLLDADSEPARIYLPFSGIWPTTILAPGSPIQITYVGGYPKYSGTLSIDPGGRVATWVSGDQFPAAIAGTFIQVGQQSSTILSVDSLTQLTLASTVETGAADWSANAVPHAIKQAILFLAAHFYENREMVVVGHVATIATEIPYAVDDLLDFYRNFHSVPIGE